MDTTVNRMNDAKFFNLRDKGSEKKEPATTISSSKLVILISYHNFLAANLTIEQLHDYWVRRINSTCCLQSVMAGPNMKSIFKSSLDFQSQGTKSLTLNR